MAVVHGSYEPLLELRHHLNVRLMGKIKNKHEVSFEPSKSSQGLYMVTNVHMEIHQWMRPPKVGHKSRHEIGCQCLAGDQLHATATQTLQFLDLRAHFIKCADATTHILYEQFTGGGQPHTAPEPLEKRDT